MAGAISGAFLGSSSIPLKWKRHLHIEKEIQDNLRLNTYWLKGYLPYLAFQLYRLRPKHPFEVIPQWRFALRKKLERVNQEKKVVITGNNFASLVSLMLDPERKSISYKNQIEHNLRRFTELDPNLVNENIINTIFEYVSSESRTPEEIY